MSIVSLPDGRIYISKFHGLTEITTIHRQWMPFSSFDVKDIFWVDGCFVVIDRLKDVWKISEGSSVKLGKLQGEYFVSADVVGTTIYGFSYNRRHRMAIVGSMDISNPSSHSVRKFNDMNWMQSGIMHEGQPLCATTGVHGETHLIDVEKNAVLETVVGETWYVSCYYKCKPVIMRITLSTATANQSKVCTKIVFDVGHLKKYAVCFENLYVMNIVMICDGSIVILNTTDPTIIRVRIPYVCKRPVKCWWSIRTHENLGEWVHRFVVAVMLCARRLAEKGMGLPHEMWETILGLVPYGGMLGKPLNMKMIGCE